MLRPGSQKWGSELIGRKPPSEHREAGRVCCGVTIDSVMGFPGVTCTLLEAGVSCLYQAALGADPLARRFSPFLLLSRSV